MPMLNTPRFQPMEQYERIKDLNIFYTFEHLKRRPNKVSNRQYCITANYILDIEDYKHDAPFYIRYVIDEKYIKKFLRMVKMGRYDA
jgi:hypothetical protein